MKKSLYNVAALAILLACLAPSAGASLSIQNDGSDGALNISSDTVIDLSQAVTGTWSDNNSANQGKGIYDPSKWAVVFKYSSVTVAAGATVTFSNHPSHAPVVWLVSGDAVINGTVSVNGQNCVVPPLLAEGGPGGFRGGAGNMGPGAGPGAGFGPGGGNGGGTYTYGNPSLLPLLGGSGGSGGWDFQSASGSAGGGAILIACSGGITIGSSGSVTANGGSCFYTGGSGGGIRLVCSALSGSGVVNALAGSASWNNGQYPGGVGRIRLERVTASSDLRVVPDPSLLTLQPNDTPLIWPPNDAPTIQIVSIGGVSTPADPRAAFGAVGPDVALPQTTLATVVVQTVNAEAASQVLVRVTPHSNANYTESAATLTQTNSASPLTLLWTASLPVSNGDAAVIARVIRP